MPEEDNSARRTNTVSTLMKSGSAAELMRSKLGAANGSEPEMDYHEGKGSQKSYEGYPKEFYTEKLDFKGKIELILRKKEITMTELITSLKIDKTTFKEYYEKNRIPKNDVLEKLSEFSGYPVSFFKAPPMEDTTKGNHKKKVILSILLVLIVLGVLVFALVYMLRTFK